MSLKRNIVAGYASQIYVTLVGILLIPLYLKDLGSEAFGLVGFFSMLQAWFNVLDFGLTPTIARETARYHAGKMSRGAFLRLYSSLSTIFLCIAVIAGGILFFLAETLVHHWLNIENLPLAEVLAAVQIMAVSVSLRWMGGLYRGVITGGERVEWISGFNSLIATLRFVGVLGSMWLFGNTPIVFFGHQLVVALIEILGLLAMCHRILPSKNGMQEVIGWSFDSIRPLMRFSMTIAVTSSIWVLVTQTDKLILSGILSLAEYGFFSLAVLLASGISIISGPISLAIMPRMARLHVEEDYEGVIRVYSRATQLVSVIVGSLTVTIVVCSESFIFAWTGNFELAQAAAPILRLYAIGNGLLALGAFPYYLQYARGDLRYHLIGNLIIVVILVPAIILAAMKAGGVGAGWVWVAMNAIYLIFWVGYVHYRLEPGMHMPWLINNFLIIVLPISFIGLALTNLQFIFQSRLNAFLYTVLIFLICFMASSLASPIMRTILIKSIRSKSINDIFR